MTRSQFSQQFTLFCLFMQHDYYLYRKRIPRYLANYAVLYACLHALSFGYIQSSIYFGANTVVSSAVFIGNFLLTVIILTYRLSIELLYDLESNRTIEYFMTLWNPRLIIMQRIFFGAIFSACILSPYYLTAKIMLGSYFVTSALSWSALVVMICASCLCLSALNYCAMTIVKKGEDAGLLWTRIYVPLLALGGYWVPWYGLRDLSPILAYASLANPFIYVTDGLKQAILNSDRFFKVATCVYALLGFTMIFTVCALIAFKKRMDHI